MTERTFRTAAVADAPALVRLIELAYRGADAEGVSWSSEAHLLKGPRTSLDEIAALIARRDSIFLMLEEGSNLLGCILLQKLSGAPEAGRKRETGAYFGMFAIDPTIRVQGLGKVLLAEAETKARLWWSAAYMTMTVINVRTALIEWYERRGYHKTGGRQPFPFTPNSGETTRDFDLIEMRKDLPPA
jgi:ribosomal protein S18 acetylase RimI-like enzyme